MRTRTSFQKRQKEIARAEKQRDKAAKRQQKKLLPKQPLPDGEEIPFDELAPADDMNENMPEAASGHHDPSGNNGE